MKSRTYRYQVYSDDLPYSILNLYFCTKYEEKNFSIGSEDKASFSEGLENLSILKNERFSS